MLRLALLAAAIAVACPAYADANLDALRAELNTLKSTYEARIQALEARLQVTETKTAEATPASRAAAPPNTSVTTASNRFNPDISLIMQGRYAHLKNQSESPITGFMSNGKLEAPTRGFSVDDSELVISSNIDPYFRGYFNAVLKDESVGVEEAWVQTLALGHGLTLKGGRFRSGIGYQNAQHPHAWDFATNSLMGDTLFGEGYGNDGQIGRAHV